jgi:hypothetical protein
MKTMITTILFLLIHAFTVSAQQTRVQSPNGKIGVALHKDDAANWYLQVRCVTDGKETEAVPRIDLGLVRNDQAFSNNLVLLKVGKPLLIHEQYTAVHGKRLHRTNTANEVTAYFETPAKAKMNLIIRAWNDGVSFRYEFPEKQGSFIIKEERTAYSVPPQTMRWMEKWNTANEGLYTAMSDDKVQQQDWCYPALFNTPDKACWFLLHESDVDRGYCGTKLRNTEDKHTYKLAFPNPKDGNGLGDSLPTIRLPWKSPWRVMIAGSLQDIVASTLVEDVATPSVINNTDWIRPGLVSWNYWSSNHGTKDYKIVTAFADLAARMNWPYTLFDWEWDAMSNGGTLEDAARYSLSKGVKPLIWYNSGGKHTNVSSTPRDRMLTHENRVAEFTKLKKLGFAGVKVDFFESEKQDMINYYLDILEDAARFEMMVYFHGCMVPRGWARTYPNLMTNEAVRGAEWYNNGPEFTATAPEHNTILPFTRNVVGAMDYTPVTFTNSQFPHLTSYGHELALSVLFESALQHLADRPEGYDGLPDAARAFLKTVPTAWDDTQLLDGYPGKEVIMARRKDNDWYIGGINGEIRPKKKKIALGFLKPGVQYKMTLIADGGHDKVFDVQQLVVNQSTTIEVALLRRGGFVASLVSLP